MKKSIIKNSVLYILSLTLIACNKEDVNPPVNSILGEWVAEESQFYTITVNGQVMSLTEFGIEVLKMEESGAEPAAREYLQNNFMGPIAMEDPKLTFLPMQTLVANILGEQIEGNWAVINDGTLLNLSVNSLPVSDFSYNINKLTNNELELNWEWAMGLLQENSEFYQVGITIKLAK